MRKIIVAAFTSMDGVMQAPGGPTEDTSGGFRLGGWTVPYADQDFGQVMGQLFSRPFALLLGRRTYDIFAGHWPKVPADSEDAGLAGLFNGVDKYVATHEPDSLGWKNSHALGPDIVASLRELKRQDGPDLLTQGSSDLLHQLFATDLVDDVQTLTFPILLGKGKRLFGEHGHPGSFRLLESVTTPSGIVASRYQRAGDVQTGSFAL